jgi:TetR/AcrR family transcriptional regulator, tetracycline repressor protein
VTSTTNQVTSAAPAQRTGRAAWGSLNRKRIVDAATDVISGGGYQNMSIRGLAAELGVAPMSLYRHVRDKDDILDEVVDRLLADSWRPTAPTSEWRAWITEASERLRSLLVSQPAALYVFLRHPVDSPAAVARMEAVMGVMRSVIVDEGDARRAYAAVHTYTLGFAALQAARDAWTPSVDGVSALSLELASYTTRAQFADGLARLLDGISPAS